MTDPILNLELSRVQAAELSRTSPSFIAKLEKQGVLHVNANGKFKLTDFWAEWNVYKDTRRSSSKMASQERLATLKIEKLEREAAIADKEYLRGEDVKNWQRQWLPLIRTAVLSIGPQVTRDREQRAFIDGICTKACNDLMHAIDNLEETIP